MSLVFSKDVKVCVSKSLFLFGGDVGAEGRKGATEHLQQKRSRSRSGERRGAHLHIMDIVVLIIVLFLKDLCPFYGHL